MKMLTAMIAETEDERRNHDSCHHFVNMNGELTAEGEALVGLAIEVLNRACFTNSDAHGWYEQYWQGTDENPKAFLGQRNFGEVMALITSEVSEAFEAYRDGDDQTRIKYGYKDTEGYVSGFIRNGELGKPEGIAAELADVIIRVCDYAGAYGVPLGEAIIRKHTYNFTRPYRHGGKLA